MTRGEAAARPVAVRTFSSIPTHPSLYLAMLNIKAMQYPSDQ